MLKKNNQFSTFTNRNFFFFFIHIFRHVQVHQEQDIQIYGHSETSVSTGGVSMSHTRGKLWTWSYFGHKGGQYKDGRDSSVKYVRLNLVLEIEKRLEILMRHVAGELSIECLLSIIKFTQFMKYIEINFNVIISNSNNSLVRKIKQKLVKLADNIQISDILTNNDNNNDRIFQKILVDNVSSSFDVNTASPSIAHDDDNNNNNKDNNDADDRATNNTESTIIV